MAAAPKRVTDVRPAKWEVAWDSKSSRWFYQDRNNGITQWKKPPGCTLELPTQEPKAPEAPSDLPPGWEAAWDPSYKRFYFYNRHTEERSWKKPPASQTTAAGHLATAAGHPATAPGKGQAALPVAAGGGATSSGARGGATSSGAPPLVKDVSAGRSRPDRNADWDAEAFLLRLREARRTGDRYKVKAVLKEVAESNYALSRNNWRPVPRTVAIPPAAAERCRLSGGSREPQITFSRMTTADAAFYFTVMTKGAVVCALNFAHGSQIGGGYKNGAIAQEEDLCRRFPQFYSSLFNASREGLYPFGPITCSSASRPDKYSDVLFTKDLILARASEDEGYQIYEPAMQKKISVITAAAPNLSDRGTELYDRNLLYKTVKSIFIAPKMQHEQVNTLILGAWGCCVFGGNPKDISELFVQAMLTDKLGRLYSEIHFAIPSFNPEDVNSKVFLDTLTRHRIAYTEINTIA